MPVVQYALALAGCMDELLVRIFDTEPTVRDFIRENEPKGVDGAKNDPDCVFEGPLAHAFNVRGCGPSARGVLGYLVTELQDGVPVRSVFLDFTTGPSPDLSVPLFPLQESVV